GAKSAHNGVRYRDLIEAINRSRLVDRALPDQQRESPSLTAVLDELGVTDRTPCGHQLVSLVGQSLARSHRPTPSSRRAHTREGNTMRGSALFLRRKRMS